MSKKQPKTYFCETWKANIQFCIGWKQFEWEDHLQKVYNFHKQYDAMGGATLFVEQGGFQRFLIWTRKKTDYPTLAHECTHAAVDILHERGVKIDPLNQEPLAYLVEEIFSNAIK